MRDLFASDPGRFEEFSLTAGPLLLDYSKNRITGETMRHLFGLARDAGIETQRVRMFSGERINATEDRPVLHTALRNRGPAPVIVNGNNVMPEIEGVLERMRVFSNSVRDG